MILYAHAAPSGELRANGGAVLLYTSKHAAEDALRKETLDDRWVVLECSLHSILHPLSIDMPEWVRRNGGTR